MLSKLNQPAGEGWVRVDPELFGLVEKGLRAAKITDGAYRSVRGAYLPTFGTSAERVSPVYPSRPK